MRTAEYSLDIHSSIDSIADNLLEQDREDVAETLEAEFGIDFYPMDRNPENRFQMESANSYMRASFGISSILADEYSGPQDSFFHRRSEDFEEFLEELGYAESGHNTEHLIQYANLYENIAEEEEIELGISTNLLVLEKKRTIREKVAEALKEFDEKLQTSETEKLA